LAINRVITLLPFTGSSHRKDSHVHIKKPARLATRGHRSLLVSGVLACLLLYSVAGAQGLTGALIGTVRDDQDGVLSGAVVRLGGTANRPDE